ncbi:MAG TPA: CCA tRNA nucleotidyltransferase [Planctomycetota bacterium]|jgi:poly(A) polymerase|nr:CCA tRNA nucleotidyltransferase [Planctomycetota bacterium]
MERQTDARFEPSALAAARGGGGAEAAGVVDRLRKAGHEAYLAGGVVRDLLLGREPGDFDVATSARPEEVERLFRRTVPLGRAFGTIAVVGEKESVQVTTFRRDGLYVDARHPESVSFGGAREDARRRDFTVNGIFGDPASGEVLDYVGGVPDLRAGVLRAIGDPDARFREDALRILRFPRFAAQLGFDLDPATEEAARATAGLLSRISAERIRDEIAKILTGPAPGRGLRLLDRLGILPVVLPEIAAMKGVAQPPEFHPEGDVFEHTCLVLEQLEPRSLFLAFAALLHDVGKPPTFRVAERIRFDGHAKIGSQMSERILRRLRFSRREVEGVARLVADHLRMPDVPKMREGRRRLFLRRADFEDLLALHRADCLGCHGDLAVYRAVGEARARLREEELRPPRLLSGNDLIALGYPPGPRFGEILRGLEVAQLEGEVADREAAVGWVRARHPLKRSDARDR